MNTNTLYTLRNITKLVEMAAAGGHTIELLVTAQIEGDTKYCTHFLVIDGEWDMTNRRNYKVAKAEFDDCISFWSGD